MTASLPRAVCLRHLQAETSRSPLGACVQVSFKHRSLRPHDALAPAWLRAASRIHIASAHTQRFRLRATGRPVTAIQARGNHPSRTSAHSARHEHLAASASEFLSPKTTAPGSSSIKSEDYESSPTAAASASGWSGRWNLTTFLALPGQLSPFGQRCTYTRTNLQHRINDIVTHRRRLACFTPSRAT